MSEYAEYCPICGRDIKPDNVEEFESGYHVSLIYIHDDLPHSDEDLEALDNGVQ